MAARSFSRDSILYFIGIVLSRGQTFLLVPFLARRLGSAELGYLDVLAALGLLITTTAGMHADTVLSSVYRHHGDSGLPSHQHGSRSPIPTVLLGATVLVASVFVLFIGAQRWWTPVVAGFGLKSEWTILTVATGCITALTAPLSLLLRLKGSVIAHVIIQIGGASFGLAGSLWVLHSDSSDIGRLLLVNLLSSAAVLLAMAYTERRCLWGALDREVAKRFLSVGLPLIPMSCFAWILGSIDRPLLLRLSGAEEVGIYGMAARLAGPAGVVLGAFNVAWMPFAMRNFHEPDRGVRFRQVVDGLVVGGGLLVVCAAFGIPLLIGSVIPSKFDVSANLIGSFVLRQLLLTGYYVTLAFFIATSRTWAASCAFAIGALVNMGLALAWTPKWGAVGLNASCIAGSVVMLVCAAVLARMLSGFDMHSCRLGIALGVLCSFCMAMSLTEPPRGLGWCAAFIGSGTAYILATRVLNLWSGNSLRVGVDNLLARRRARVDLPNP